MDKVTQETAKGIEIKLTQVITFQAISDLLVGAFEGGSNYWAVITGMKKPVNFDNTPAEYMDYKRHSYPINAGGSVTIESDDGENKGTLDLTTIKRGLEIMAREYPIHWTDWHTGNDDATTSDIFLQLCLFGKLIYG